MDPMTTSEITSEYGCLSLGNWHDSHRFHPPGEGYVPLRKVGILYTIEGAKGSGAWRDSRATLGYVLRDEDGSLKVFYSDSGREVKLVRDFSDTAYIYGTLYDPETLV